jgi:hypothetical protein
MSSPAPLLSQNPEIGFLLQCLTLFQRTISHVKEQSIILIERVSLCVYRTRMFVNLHPIDLFRAGAISALIDNFHDIFRRAVQDYLLPGLNVHSSPCIQLENCTASGKELVDAALAKKGARLGLGPYKFNCHDANLKFLDFWEKKHCLLPLLSHIPSALCNTFDTQAVLTCHSVISAVIR